MRRVLGQASLRVGMGPTSSAVVASTYTLLFWLVFFYSIQPFEIQRFRESWLSGGAWSPFALSLSIVFALIYLVGASLLIRLWQGSRHMIADTLIYAWSLALLGWLAFAHAEMFRRALGGIFYWWVFENPPAVVSNESWVFATFTEAPGLPHLWVPIFALLLIVALAFRRTRVHL